MMKKFTLKMEDSYSSNSTEVVFKFETIYLQDVLEHVEKFLNGCGFDVPPNSLLQPDWPISLDDFPDWTPQPDDDEEYTEEEVKSNVISWFDSPAFRRNNNDGEKETNFDLKECFDVQDRLSTEKL